MICFPSGDQVGNPLFGRPLVRSLDCCEPSERTIINFAGMVSRALKKPPNPKAIRCPSGDQVGTKAAPDLSAKTTFLSAPSAFITEIDAVATVARFLISLMANFPSRENLGKTSVYSNCISGSQLYRG